MLPLAGVPEGKMMSNLVGRKIRQFPTTFMQTTCLSFDISNDISSRQELEGYPPRPPEALLSILAISRSEVIQMLYKCYGWKEKMISNNFHAKHFTKFYLHQCHFI